MSKGAHRSCWCINIYWLPFKKRIKNSKSLLWLKQYYQTNFSSYGQIMPPWINFKIQALSVHILQTGEAIFLSYYLKWKKNYMRKIPLKTICFIKFRETYFEFLKLPPFHILMTFLQSCLWLKIKGTTFYVWTGVDGIFNIFLMWYS